MTDTGAKDGLICIEPLTAKGHAARRYREQNREKIREYDRRYSAEHREQKRANAAEWHQRNRQRKKDANADRYAIIGGFLNAVREEASCADCGDSESPLEFDHLWGKLFDVGAFGRRAIKTIKAEIAKCDLVCKPCHDWRTVARILGHPPGTRPPTYVVVRMGHKEKEGSRFSPPALA